MYRISLIASTNASYEKWPVNNCCTARLQNAARSVYSPYVSLIVDWRNYSPGHSQAAMRRADARVAAIVTVHFSGNKLTNVARNCAGRHSEMKTSNQFPLRLRSTAQYRARGTA